jgi:hypothetical protein
MEILDQAESEQTEENVIPDSVPEIKKQIQSLGRKLLKDEQDLTEVWPMVGALELSDWKMVWPSLDIEILQKLYTEATDNQKKEISASDAEMLHDYARSYVKESIVMYENEIWQVQIPSAPDDLVGIRNAIHMILVPRRSLQSLQEHVMGMTAMPTLVRMKELAGMATPQVDVPVVTSYVSPVKQTPSDWLSELRMHMREIEKLHAEPETADTKEEIHLHMKAIHRKAQKAADQLKDSQ